MSFRLSAAASKRISALCLAENKPFFRLSVDSGGCSGFSYVFGFADEVRADDLKIEQNGAILLVDAVSLPFVQGGQLDFVESLSGSYFKVENPNASGGCGCGTSFAV